jgi:tetratricopeptide (TPR) repeat protein
MNRRLPFLVALGTFALYAAASSHGVTVNSLPMTAKVAGWDGTPLVGHPLFWLLTLPLRLFPDAWVPLCLNLFSAATAALTLGVLARTIQILPWDKPRKSPPRQPGALPVLLACALCGLEFHFWQEATATTGETLGLLLLATALWLLLEYRVRRESRWLNAAILVWGLGMAENWAMLPALPLFVAGVIWLRKYYFFRLKFLLRMAGLGLAGFSIYALLPLANGLAPQAHGSWGQAWRASWQQTQDMARLPLDQFLRVQPVLAVGVILYFLVPILPCLVRMPDTDMRNKQHLDRFQIRLYQRLRGLLLVTCVWLAFDPTIGPRQILQNQFGLSLPLLTFDYLNALGAGFLAGNLLLLARGAIHRRRSPAGIQWWQQATPFAAGSLGLIIAGLVAINAPAILHLNFHPLQRFGELAAESLPAGHGVMLSDQPQKLWVFQAAMSHRRNGPDWLAVDTRALPSAAYRARLERRQPAGWLTDENRHELTPPETMRLLEQIARTHRLFCLHPSYGDWVEPFYPEPAGAIYEMTARPENFQAPPPLSAAKSGANETFWSNAWTHDLARLAPATRPQDRLLAEWYSCALNGWGVALQRQGQWRAAQLCFEQALQLDTNNFPARINLTCNTRLQAGHQLELEETDTLADQLEGLEHLNPVMDNHGPFDEPSFCLLLGRTFQKNGLPRQAAEQFERARILVPDALAPEFALAELYTQLQWADRVPPLLRQLHDQIKKLPQNDVTEVDLALLESKFWLTQTNPANAQNVLQSIWPQHSNDVRLANQMMNVYCSSGNFTNALQIMKTQLDKSPDDVPSLNNQAVILIQSGQTAAALPVLDRILTLTNEPSVRLNRAIAQIDVENFDAAEADFRELEKGNTDPGTVSYGLAMIAEHRHDTNQVIHYLRLCVANTPAEKPLWRQASVRLQALEPAEPAK